VPLNDKEAILTKSLRSQGGCFRYKRFVVWPRYCWLQVKSQNYHFIKKKKTLLETIFLGMVFWKRWTLELPQNLIQMLWNFAQLLLI